MSSPDPAERGATADAPPAPTEDDDDDDATDSRRLARAEALTFAILAVLEALLPRLDEDAFLSAFCMLGELSVGDPPAPLISS